MLINLTPHDVNLAGETTETIPSTGLARVDTVPGSLEDIGLPVPVAQATQYGEIIGLPDAVEGTYYIVSAVVGNALVKAGISRPDVLCPGTGPNDGAIRNEKNHVIGVTRLVRATG